MLSNKANTTSFCSSKSSCKNGIRSCCVLFFPSAWEIYFKFLTELIFYSTLSLKS